MWGLLSRGPHPLGLLVLFDAGLDVLLTVFRPFAFLGALFSAATAVGVLTGAETPPDAFFFPRAVPFMLTGSMPR